MGNDARVRAMSSVPVFPVLLLFSLRQGSKGKGRLDILPIPFSLLVLVVSLILIVVLGFAVVRAGMLGGRGRRWHRWRPGEPETFCLQREQQGERVSWAPPLLLYSNLRLSSLQTMPVVRCKLDLNLKLSFPQLRSPHSSSGSSVIHTYAHSALTCKF